MSAYAARMFPAAPPVQRLGTEPGRRGEPAARAARRGEGAPAASHVAFPYRRTMYAIGRTSRRALGIALLAAALGFATTTAVALVCAWTLPPVVCSGQEIIRFPERHRCGIVVQRLDRRGGVDITVQTGAIVRMGDGFDAGAGRVEAMVPRWARDELVPWGWDGQWRVGQRSARHLIPRGWPWPAFAATLEAQGSTPDGPMGWKVLRGIERTPSAVVPMTATVPDVLPIWPLWWGLLLDIAFFTVVWLGIIVVIVVAWSITRRRLRRRRGLCVACGYPVRRGARDGDHRKDRACPECGCPV